MIEYKTKGKAIIYETAIIDIVGAKDGDEGFIGMKYIGQKKEDRKEYLGSGIEFNDIKNYLERKYGKDKVIFEKIIFEVYEEKDILVEGETKEQFAKRIKENKRIWLNEREYYYTRYYNAVKSERYFNQKEGGDVGGFSKEVLEKKRKASLGEKNGMYGKTHSDDVKSFLSEINKERWKDPEYRKKMIEIVKERWKDPTIRKKMIENNSGDKHYLFGKHVKEESKIKQSKTLKEYYKNNPDAKKAMSERAKERCKDPEVLKRLSELREHTKREIIIEGVVYRGIRTAARLLNIKRQTLSGRLKSRSERFKDWHFVGEKKDIIYFNAVIIEGKLYACANEAARQLKMKNQTMISRLKSKSERFKNYQYA